MSTAPTFKSGGGDEQILHLPLEIKTAETEGSKPGTFEGYGSIFGNMDRDGDVVAKGAFAESLKGGMPALLWQHDQKQPIGRFDMVREDKHGLHVKGQLATNGKGKEAYELLKMGALNGLSIGFVTKEASRDPATGARTIMKADLMEISLVTFPANEMARVSSVKSYFKDTSAMTETRMIDDAPLIDNAPLIGNARAFERLLRENGFSRSRAKAITAKGFQCNQSREYGVAEIADLIGELHERKGFFKQLGNAERIRNSGGSALCQKAEGNHARCQALKNDIIDGNNSLWEARKKLVSLTQELLTESKAFVRKFDNDRGLTFTLDLVSVAQSLAAAAKKKVGGGMLPLLADVGALAVNLAKYNGDFAKEYRRFIGPHQRAISRAKDQAEHLEKSFQIQADTHKREGCSTLPSSAFNQPAGLRF
ncbi:MAG: HK97 family phage prohead protease [Kordiimonadales bacterium]|nr:MAG: HK97 family phage prohead protease [Kordiimonadales bacterium]